MGVGNAHPKFSILHSTFSISKEIYMASNQRENARKEKQLNKERKVRIIIWAALIIIVVVLAIMRVAEIDFSSVKSRISGAGLAVGANADVYPYELDSSSGVEMSFVNDKIVALTDSSCKVINPPDAKELYSFSCGYANPVMTSAGKFLFTIDQGGTRFRLDNTAENVYESATEERILCGDVSKNGNVIYATRSSNNKIKLIVMNNSLKKLVEFRVKDGYLLAVAIDASGKRFAYATVTSEKAKPVTTLHTYNIGDTKPKATFKYSESNVIDLQYTSSGELYYVGDESVHLIKSQKKDVEVFAHDKAHTVTFNYTNDGELIYVYSKYTDANENFVTYINSNGKVKTTIEVSQKPKYVSATNDICVLFTDKIVTYSMTKGTEKQRFKCDDSVSSASKLSSKIFVTRNQLIDVLDDED